MLYQIQSFASSQTRDIHCEKISPVMCLTWLSLILENIKIFVFHKSQSTKKCHCEPHFCLHFRRIKNFTKLANHHLVPSGHAGYFCKAVSYSEIVSFCRFLQICTYCRSFFVQILCEKVSRHKNR